MDGETKGSLRVLLVGPGVAGGGAEGRFAMLARKLFDGCLPAAVLTGDSEDVSPEERNRFIFLSWRNRWSYLRIMPRFWLLVRRGGFRVMFAFGLFPCLLAAFATLGRKRDICLIVNEINNPERQDKDSRVFWLRRLLHKYLRRWTYRRASLLTANSIDGLREMCAIAGVDESRGRRVHNLVEPVALAVKADERADNPLAGRRYFVCTSRFDPEKRIDTTLKAFSLLPKDEDIYLLIVGDGPARDELKALAARLGLSARTYFAGWQKNPLPLVKNAAAFILASEYEGFSNSLLEAMFLDTPVITSLCGADAHEMCAQGAALGFTTGDAEQLAAQMIHLLTEPGLTDELVGNARRYRRLHTVEESLPHYEKLVLAVLAGRAPDKP